MITAGLERRQNRQKVIFKEEHGRNDDVALGDVIKAVVEPVGIGAPF